MMAELKPFEFFLLRYVPDAVKNEFVNIGVVLIEPGAGFADVRFTQDWGRVRRLDPQVDTDWLEAMEREIRAQLHDVPNRNAWMRRVQESFSGAMQLSETTGCLAEDPAKELATLVKMFVNAPPTVPEKEKKEPVHTGRRFILAAMEQAFSAAGISKLLMRDMPVESYTAPDDPFRFDFGYRLRGSENNIKLLQAVSFKGNDEAGIVFSARYAAVASAMSETLKANVHLTAILDGTVDRTKAKINFAMRCLERPDISVASVKQMPEIARAVASEISA
jgi:hypothetical protein